MIKTHDDSCEVMLPVKNPTCTCHLMKGTIIETKRAMNEKGIARPETRRDCGAESELWIGDELMVTHVGLGEWIQQKAERINAEHERMCPYKAERDEMRALLRYWRPLIREAIGLNPEERATFDRLIGAEIG
jgi:hypothetical protein